MSYNVAEYANGCLFCDDEKMADLSQNIFHWIHTDTHTPTQIHTPMIAVGTNTTCCISPKKSKGNDKLSVLINKL